MANILLSDALTRAKAQALTASELLSIVGQLAATGNPYDLIELYRTWLEHHPADPLRHAICFNYAVILSNCNELTAARDALNEAIRVNPDFMPPYINLGNVLERMGSTGDAVQQWYTAVNKLGAITGEASNYKTTALKQIGRVLEKFQLDENAEEALRLSLDINPNQSDVIQHYVSLRQRQCKWPVIVERGSLTKELLLKGISSLSLAAHTDDPMLQLANAAHYSKHNIGRPKKTYEHTHRRHLQSPDRGRRKIGYLSSDLREHAIGYLTSEVYELHDRSKVEVYLYYCGHEVSDSVQARIKSAADHWIDLTGVSDEQAAERIVADGIEILIDLNGYTHGARTKMLAMRPAPIIVNWLGFPGSLGNPSHHYIIADDFIIPKESEIYYAEKVLRLPCYQPNDRKRIIAKETPTRQALKLPEDAMVYCCFNGVHKVTPFTWRRWMSILKQVPNSVLWLLDSIESTNVRLKQHAASHGIDPSRIIFAPKARNPEHLARYPLADLFLDSSPYGAHTTSSDALWMGVPVLTLVGRSFASRVCGSLVRSAGIGELVCTTEEEFTQKAVDLANDRAKLKRYRQRLNAARDNSVLFDTPRLVSSLETLYAEMWAEFKAGRLPRPDLSNLDIYNDIGIEIDSNDVELLKVPNYKELYQQKLAERDRYSLIRPDDRLWSGAGHVVQNPQQTFAVIEESPELLLNAAAVQAQAGNTAQAAELLDRCLAREPRNVVALDLAARVALVVGKVDQAETYARKAVNERPIIPFGLTLAEVLKAKGQLKGAVDFFESVLQTEPQNTRALIGLGEIYEHAGQRVKAAEHFAAVLRVEPANMVVAIRYSNLMPTQKLSSGLDALRKAAPPKAAPAKLRLNFLTHFIMYKEWTRRAAQGLMPYHVTSLNELFFDASDADWQSFGALADDVLTQEPSNVDALGAKAAWLFSQGKNLDSEIFFRRIAELKPDSVLANVTFRNEFYSRLETVKDDDIVRNLPPMTDVLEARFEDAPVIFLSCNYDYYVNFTRSMLLSINSHCPRAQLHLHVMDIPDHEIAPMRAFISGLSHISAAITIEHTGQADRGVMPARNYYHSIRLVRMHQLLKRYMKPLWLMDVDALLNRDPQPMLKAMGSADTAFRARPARWEPWNQFNASVFAIAPTERGMSYLRLIAAYIAYFQQEDRLRWGIDQLAMYGVYEHLKSKNRAPSVHLLNDRAVDYECHDDGFVWCNSGKEKFSQMLELGKISQDSEDAGRGKYIKSFKKYATQLST